MVLNGAQVFAQGGAHKHFFDRDACPRTNFNYPKI